MRITEARNEKSDDLHNKNIEDIVDIINEEDKTVAFSVQKEKEKIAEAVSLIVDSFQNSGRLFFIGAGTSGRLGIIQAAECPPTFGTDPEMVQGVIAGGPDAVFKSKEGAEDEEEEGFRIVKEKLHKNDVIVGVSAGGTTKFVIGALKSAKILGCKTVSVSCNENAEVSKLADVAIEVVVGPEVLTGSTRMKAGTAQKMVLDILTTAAMINLGRVTGNLMTCLQARSEKLKERAKQIVIELTNLKNLDQEEAYKKATDFLEKNHYDVQEVLLSLGEM